MKIYFKENNIRSKVYSITINIRSNTPGNRDKNPETTSNKYI